MKNPFYTVFAIASCLYLGLANLRGWNYFTSSANRSAFSSTSYRYRPAIHTSSGSSGGWFSSGGGFHK
ncbi:MAG: hypothetical protein RIS79_25 [Verrucomicrobiota bacterium]|jgi:hypothetical protein